jgi:DNA repair exonuclease SbcCD ATPase subunit
LERADKILALPGIREPVAAYPHIQNNILYTLDELKAASGDALELERQNDIMRVCLGLDPEDEITKDLPGIEGMRELAAGWKAKFRESVKEKIKFKERIDQLETELKQIKYFSPSTMFCADHKPIKYRYDSKLRCPYCLAGDYHMRATEAQERIKEHEKRIAQLEQENTQMQAVCDAFAVYKRLPPGAGSTSAYADLCCRFAEYQAGKEEA